MAALLQAGRSTLPGVDLHGLIDPDRPPLDDIARAHFDAIHPNAYAAGRPHCLVRLSPADPLFAARLIQTVPSVAVASGLPLDRAVEAYWLRRSDAVVERDALWSTVRRVMRPGQPRIGSLAVFTTSPAAALQARGAMVFGAELVPLLSARFDRTLFIIEGRGDEAGLLTLLRRYGGDVLLTGTCLLPAYGDHAAALASAELGRDVPLGELAHWRAGIVRPGALLLGEVAAAARDLFVPSDWAADAVRTRFGRAARVVPIAAVPLLAPLQPGVIAAVAGGLQAEACIWALELLRSWGHPARLLLDCPIEQRGALSALAAGLGLATAVTFGAGRGGITACLGMRGDGMGAAGLIAALGSGRCVASRGLSEVIDGPAWLGIVPDQASPPLLAAALHAALTGEPPSEPALTEWTARHAAPAVAASLL